MFFRRALRHAARRVPAVRALLDQRGALLAEREVLRAELDAAKKAVAAQDRARGFVPPGHFYSPLPDWCAVDREAARLFPEPPPRALPGIALREAEQLALIDRLAPYYAEMPFAAERQPGLRYSFDNGAYSYSDAIFLYLMLRDLRPRRVVEIGSGHSSCVVLDTVERFLGDATRVTFIEPYPDLLHSLLQPGDAARVTILPVPLQEVPLETFTALETGDVLFVDSTHVAKIGSDVTALFDTILPALRDGVRVHFHDVFYPFEYPRYWFAEGRAWNEAYLLRAFLQFNDRFRVELWNHFLLTFHESLFAERMPLCLRNKGASLWLSVGADPAHRACHLPPG